MAKFAWAAWRRWTKGSLSRLDLGHGTAEVRALLLEISHGSLKRRLPPSRRKARAARQVRRESGAPIGLPRGRGGGARFSLKVAGARAPRTAKDLRATQRRSLGTHGRGGCG